MNRSNLNLIVLALLWEWHPVPVQTLELEYWIKRRDLGLGREDLRMTLHRARLRGWVKSERMEDNRSRKCHRLTDAGLQLVEHEIGLIRRLLDL